MSLRQVLRGMGAVPCNAGPLERQWQLLLRRIAVARLRQRRGSSNAHEERDDSLVEATTAHGATTGDAEISAALSAAVPV